jgi:putative sterol carrier protein|tara:strand:+ start:375 stop:764 length:390 start_codon:yes stop_codon:yes gene_type:complete
LTRFWSEDFFEKTDKLLNDDKELLKVFTGMNTTIIAECSDKEEVFYIIVEDGRINSSKASVGDKGEFRFSAPYDLWVKVAKGEEKVQSQVVRGKIKFTGSMPKMLLYLGKVVRMEKKILKIIKDMDLEF